MNKICINCSNSFEIVNHNKANKYCSHSCYHEHSKKERITVQCINCNKDLIKYEKQINKSISKIFYCSRKCFYAYGNVIFECNSCRQKISCKRHKLKEDKLCSKCRRKIKTTKITLKCPNCNTLFQKFKSRINENKTYCCGAKCAHKYRGKDKYAIFNCKFCQRPLKRLISGLKRNKHGFFCNWSCASKYGQANKCGGSNRSKMEEWIEENLTTGFPELEIDYNNKTVCHTYELDIYIPSLKLAFELNGILHYEDIFGGLQVKKENDAKKLQICKEKGIDLIVYDTRSAKRFERNQSLGIPFLNDMIKKIEEKLAVNCPANFLNTLPIMPQPEQSAQPHSLRQPLLARPLP